ncbi:MAG: ATPase [Gelidibacter sp.]|nr:ATPase [Gelidibacter sp.]
MKKSHRNIERMSKFQLGALDNNMLDYDFNKLKEFLNIKGRVIFDKNFRLHKEDNALLFVLCCYFIQDQNSSAIIGLDINKGLLISGPVGCGKTSLMKLMPYLASHKIKYETIPTRNIVNNFNAAGFEVLKKYKDTKDYCFDDLGLEPTGCHNTRDCNVMGEILLSRYDLFKAKKVKTHITTNLNTEELEARYGSQFISRLGEMFNLVSFKDDSVDKRK